MSSVSANAGSSAIGPASLPTTVPAGTIGAAASRGRSSSFISPSDQSPVFRSTRPVWVAWVYSETRRAPRWRHILGHHDPGRTRIDGGSGVGQQLVDGVDAQRLGAMRDEISTGKRVCRRLPWWRWCARRDSRTACQRLAIGSEAHVVHRPTVHGNGSNPLRRCVRGLAQAVLKADEDLIERPVERITAMDGAVGNAMNDFDLRGGCRPAQQGNAAAFSAKIDGNAGTVSCAAGQLVLTVKSPQEECLVSPPSTGMRWPVVQRERGLARNRMASAQSTGSID